MSPIPDKVQAHPNGCHENTPPRFNGDTFMVNGLPPEQVMVTGRHTRVAEPRSGTISVSGSDEPAKEIGKSDETEYVLPMRMTTSLVTPDLAIKRGSG